MRHSTNPDIPHRGVRGALALLAATLLAVMLFPGATALAQGEPPRERQDPTAVGPDGTITVEEQIDVRLVQIPILVRDRNNQPITDLKPEELVVKDRGKKVEIAFLEPFVDTSPQAPLPDVRLKLELPGGSDTVARAGEIEPRFIIFYIDVENDQPLGKAGATQDLIRYVMEDLDDSYQAAVLSFNGAIQIDQPFTHDRSAVTRAIRDAFAQNRRPQIDLSLRIRQLVDRLEDCIDEDEGGTFIKTGGRTCLASVALEYADEVRPRSKDFLVGLEALVRFAGGLEGRKSVVAVSHGVAINPVDEVIEAMKSVYGNTLQLAEIRMELMGGEGERFLMDDVLDLAIRNEVTLHFVDRTSAPTGDYSARRGGYTTQPGSRPTLAAWQAAQMDLQEMATTTGGLFVISRDLFAGVKQAMDVEAGGYYVGYYTDRYLPRDELTKVSISSKRGRVSHRRGTYAKPYEGAEQIFRGRIALGKPQKLPPERGDGLHVPFQLIADPFDIGYTDAGQVMASNFTVHVQVEQGERPVAGSYHFVQHSYPKELWMAKDVEPILINGWVELPTGDYRLVAIFRNAKTGAGGRLMQPLQVASREAAATAGTGSR